jgi:hypothetical protein
LDLFQFRSWKLLNRISVLSKYYSLSFLIFNLFMGCFVCFIEEKQF